MKKRKIGAAIAVLTAGALALSACSSSTGGGGVVAGSQITVMWNQPLYSLNTLTTETNATANSNIVYLMNSSFNHYDDQLKLIKDTDFGTYKKVSDDPLTVKYTIKDGVKWSDGTPVGAADMILFWGAQSTHFNTVKAVKGADGKTANQAELDAGVYFNATSPAMLLVTQFPEISDDNRSVTIKYDSPRSDWEASFWEAGTPPAHVVAMHALGIKDPKEAQQAIIDAFKNKDNEKLSKIAKFWNTGFNFDSLPNDKSLYLSNGAYLLTEFVEGQYLTLTANPDYTWGKKPNVEKIIVRFNEDPLAGVTAMQNGEVNIIEPQATVDTVKALEAIKGVKIQQGNAGTYEHVDLVFNNGGPFDPATYGGDAAKALAARQAFLTCIPRQEILDKLVKPLDDKATLRNSYIYVAGADGYDKVVKENKMQETYGTGDPAKAKEMLAAAGFDTATPIPVRFLYAGTNERRIQEYQLIAAACGQAGFNLVDNGDPKWSSRLVQNTTYDASLFGWQTTNTFALNSQANFITGGANNFGGLSLEKVDSLWKQIESNIDHAKEVELVAQVEAELVKQGFGLTLFQHPGITASTETVSNVKEMPISPTVFWNFQDWKISAENVIK